MLRNQLQKFVSSRGKSRKNSRRLRLENLEHRQLFSADFSSAFAIGSAATESVYDLTLDGAGNSYVVGTFSDTVDFDPNATHPDDVDILTSMPSSSTFVAKYDSSGNLLWAQRMGGTGGAFGPDITAGSDGAVVVGSFTGTADFGTTTLTSGGGYDVYAVKLDADGNFVWARQFGGANDDAGNGVTVDASGNAYLTADTRTSSAGSSDAFLAKIDTAGNVEWTVAVGASSSIATKGKASTTGWARGYKIAVDSMGDVYATGKMSGTVDFDQSAGKTEVTGLGFVTKFSTDGQLVWARGFTDALVIEPHDIAVDSDGNVYSTGVFILKGDFDPGTSKRTQKFILDAGSDAHGTWNTATYVSALDASGNFLWAKSTQMVNGTYYRADPEAIVLDEQGGIYLAGNLSGPADFDPGAGTSTLTPAGSTDGFIWKLDSSGNFIDALQVGGIGGDSAVGIGVDAGGNIYTTGVFQDTVDFDPGEGVVNLTSAGSNDVFILKLTQPGTLASAPNVLSALTASAKTTAVTTGDLTSPDLVTVSSDVGSNPSSAPEQPQMPTKPAAKSKLVDAAMQETDDSWLDVPLQDDLLADLAAAQA